jgi:hypothetical protein
MKSGRLSILETSGSVQICTGIALSLLLPLSLPSLSYGNHMDFGVPLVSYPVDTAVFYPILKWLECEGKHSPSPSVDVSNARHLISMFSVHLRGLTARYRDDLIFTFFNYYLTGNY